MDPMSMMAVGTGINIFSQWAANMSQAQAEAQNARFYREQADYAIFSMKREMDLASREYEFQYGKVTSAYAGAGVDVGSGSAADNIARVAANQIQELAAIKKKGEMSYRLASSRARRSSQLADTLQNPMFNLTQAGTTLLTNFGKDLDFYDTATGGGSSNVSFPSDAQRLPSA